MFIIFIINLLIRLLRCKIDKSYEWYSPSCVTIVHSPPITIPSSASRVHFLSDFESLPSLSPKILQLSSFQSTNTISLPPNLTHLKMQTVFDFSFSFPSSITHLTCAILSVGKYSGNIFPPSLIFLKLHAGDFRYVVLPNLPSSLLHLWFVSSLNGPNILSFPPSLSHFHLECRLQASELPPFPSSLQVLNLSCMFMNSVLPSLPDSLKYLILPTSQCINLPTLPPHLIYLKNPPMNATLPLSIKYIHLSKTKSEIPNLPLVSHLEICFTPSTPLPSTITHLTISQHKTNFKIPSSVTHLYVIGGRIPILPPSLSHLCVTIPEPLPPTLPSSLLSLQILFQEENLPPLPPNLIQIVVSRYYRVFPPLPSSLINFSWTTSFYKHQKQDPSSYPPLPIFPPSLHILKIPSHIQPTAPRVSDGENYFTGLPKSLMLLSCSKEWFEELGILFFLHWII